MDPDAAVSLLFLFLFSFFFLTSDTTNKVDTVKDFVGENRVDNFDILVLPYSLEAGDRSLTKGVISFNTATSVAETDGGLTECRYACGFFVVAVGVEVAIWGWKYIGSGRHLTTKIVVRIKNIFIVFA
jgi:hypothetical protein